MSEKLPPIDQFTAALLHHTNDEMTRYKDILDKIEESAEKSSKRHDETFDRISHLAQSIESFIAEQGVFINAIKRAFPKDEDGQPDYDGHRTAHLAWITNSRTSKDFRATVMKNVATALLVSGIGFVTVATWIHLLKGPAL